MSKELVMILAGGKGSRLYPLSRDRAKPAVPFGGRYRVIDFALSNFTNSGFYKIKVLTQFMSNSLNRHISMGWRLDSNLGHYVDIVPPQMRVGESWYLGTADAIYQNINLIADEDAETIFIFGGDHIYRMDVRQMLDYHKKKKADLTVAVIPVPLSIASEMGVLEVDNDGKIVDFQEKPKDPKPMPGRSDVALVSMGNYIFNKEILLNMLDKDHNNRNSSHDFGKDIIPSMIGKYNIFAYDFNTNSWPNMEEKERGYWCDIGTIDAYWEANMDLCNVTPRFNLYNKDWPVRTVFYPYPPAKFVFANEPGSRVGRATDSLVSEGCIISGGQVNRCVLSPGVRINSYAYVSDSVVMEGVEIGRHCRIQRAIIDKDVCVPSNTIIGFDQEHDKKYFHVTESGIVVIPKKEIIQSGENSNK
jgi:glucose-1-phosphate adenylyltransferase